MPTCSDQPSFRLVSISRPRTFSAFQVPSGLAAARPAFGAASVTSLWVRALIGVSAPSLRWTAVIQAVDRWCVRSSGQVPTTSPVRASQAAARVLVAASTVFAEGDRDRSVSAPPSGFASGIAATCAPVRTSHTVARPLAALTSVRPSSPSTVSVPSGKRNIAWSR